MPVGVVSDLEINKDFKGVDVQVEFVKTARTLLCKNTLFWMVEPQISAKGVSGLETILRGNYIAVKPGDGEPSFDFTALDEPPPLLSAEPGLQVQLNAADQGSLSTGSKVYFKGIEVGSIERCALGKDESVQIDIFIKKEFMHLVRKTTRFYNVSGISFEGGLSGFKIRAEALSALLTGGIAFFTPSEGKEAQSGDQFQLFQNKEAAEQEGSTIKLLCGDANGISKSTVIKYRGLEIGKVFSVSMDQHLKEVEISASIQDRYRGLIREGTLFWLVKPKLGLAQTRNLETLVTGAYFAIRPGGGKLQKIFRVLPQAPQDIDVRQGLKIVLSAERLGSIKAGDPVYFRQIRVGQVTGCRLSPDAVSVLVAVDIEEPFAPLVRTDSRFWKASGIDMRFGLFSGAEVRTESLEALLEGGIAFATPDKNTSPAGKGSSETVKSRGVELNDRGEQKSQAKPPKPVGPSGSRAKNGAKFVLHDKPQDEWLKWRPVIPLEK